MRYIHAADEHTHANERTRTPERPSRHARWWRSFLTAGSSGLYLFAYSIMYFFTQLDIIGFVPTLIYFTYMFVFATLFFVITGTIGFYSCYWFVWTIYAAIKVD